MAKMPDEIVGKNKELYLAALKNTIPMYSETGKMDPKGADAVLAVFSEGSPEVAKANIDVSKTYTNKYVDQAKKTTGTECEVNVSDDAPRSFIASRRLISRRAAGAWPFAEERRAEIDAHFAGSSTRSRSCGTAASCSGAIRFSPPSGFRASYFETDFASFLAWRDWGFPDKDVFNGFGMGALRANDGAFVLGVMGEHTANAGRIYFPSGTPDLDDISGGAVDIDGSVTRELEEETGLTPGRLSGRCRIGTASSPARRLR